MYLYTGNPDFVLPSGTREKGAPLIPIIATLGVIEAAGLGAGALVHRDIRERIATVKLIVLSQPYTALPLEDSEVESRV